MSSSSSSSASTRQRPTATAAAATPKDNSTQTNSVPVPVPGRVVVPDSDDSTWVDAALTAFIVMLMLLAVSFLTTHTLHFGLLGPASTGETVLSFGSRARPNTAETQQANPAPSTSTSPLSNPNPAQEPEPELPLASSLLELEQQGQAAATGTDPATATPTGADGKPRKRFRKKKKPRGSRKFTLSELSAYDGSDPDKPIYIAVKGHVYDVSAGKQYYGKGSGYNIFAGRDCSRAFLTGCFKVRYPGHDLRGLNPDQMKEIDNWLKFYQDHETYFYVGELILPEVTEDTPLPSEDCSLYDEPGYTPIQTTQNTQPQTTTPTTTNTDTPAPVQDSNPDQNTPTIPQESGNPAVPAAA